MYYNIFAFVPTHLWGFKVSDDDIIDDIIADHFCRSISPLDPEEGKTVYMSPFVCVYFSVISFKQKHQLFVGAHSKCDSFKMRYIVAVYREKVTDIK